MMCLNDIIFQFQILDMNLGFFEGSSQQSFVSENILQVIWIPKVKERIFS